MKLILTKHAFERYLERAALGEDDFYRFQNRLRNMTRDDLCFLKWQGKPAVYFDQTYWRYEQDVNTNEITLITCLGVLEYISSNKWARQEAARHGRATKKVSKTIPRNDGIIWYSKPKLSRNGAVSHRID